MNQTHPFLRLPLSLPECYVFAVLLAAGLGNLAVILDFSANPVNLSHFVALAGLPVVFLMRRLMLPPMAMMLFFASGIITSLFAYMFYGIHSNNLVQPLYCLIMFFVMLTLGANIPRNRIIKTLKVVAWIFAAMVIIKNIFYMSEIIDTYNSGRRIWIPTLSLGGVNVEGTFLIAAAAFMFGSRMFWPYFALTTFLVLLYSSRANIISLGVILLYYLWLKRRALTKSHHIAGLAFIVVLACVGIAVVFLSPLGQYLLLRFHEIGYEPGTESRFLIWQEGFSTWLEHPWGVGAQNGIAFVQSTLANTILEDNLHSIILQYAVDMGIQTLILFLAAVIWLIRRTPRTMHTHPLTVALISYFSVAISHYGGYETFAYCWLGLWLGQWHQVDAQHA